MLDDNCPPNLLLCVEALSPLTLLVQVDGCHLSPAALHCCGLCINFASFVVPHACLGRDALAAHAAAVAAGSGQPEPRRREESHFAALRAKGGGGIHE